MLSKLGSLVVKFATLVLFLAVCYVALFFAYGYQYDAKKQDVKKTSIIDLIGNTREARITLNGQLKSNFLPYQIKSVDPGIYDLSVGKNGFLPWKRMITVEEDIVTIVNDILLVPSSLGEYTKIIRDFSNSGGLNFGSDMIFTYEPESNVIHLLSLFYDGTYKDEDLQLAVDDIKSVESLGNDRFFVTDAKDDINYFDFKKRKFIVFNRPKDSYGFKVNSGGDGMFFMIGDTLYHSGFDKFSGETPIMLPDLKIADQVNAVSYGFNGQVYFISGGVAYLTDDNFTARKPLNLSLASYNNLSFTTGRDFGYLILRTKENKRLLYVADKKGRFRLLTEDISGKPFVNGFDKLLYAENSGDVYYYDANIQDKVKVMTLQEPFELLGWFSDEGHFVFREKDMIRLGDVFNSNIYDLFEGEGVDRVFVFSKNVFYLRDKKIFALNWRDLM